MSLSASLTNALSGMRTSQNSLEVLSRNVSNAGTPGYHRQSLSVIDTKGVNSTYARSGGIERAFNKSLQAYYTSAISDAGYSSTRASTLERLQAFLGKPGDAGSLDTMFGALQNAGGGVVAVSTGTRSAPARTITRRAPRSCPKRRRWPRR